MWVVHEHGGGWRLGARLVEIADAVSFRGRVHARNLCGEMPLGVNIQQLVLQIVAGCEENSQLVPQNNGRIAL